jgi:hypothetical protein
VHRGGLARTPLSVASSFWNEFRSRAKRKRALKHQQASRARRSFSGILFIRRSVLRQPVAGVSFEPRQQAFCGIGRVRKCTLSPALENNLRQNALFSADEQSEIARLEQRLTTIESKLDQLLKERQ